MRFEAEGKWSNHICKSDSVYFLSGASPPATEVIVKLTSLCVENSSTRKLSGSLLHPHRMRYGLEMRIAPHRHDKQAQDELSLERVKKSFAGT